MDKENINVALEDLDLLAEHARKEYPMAGFLRVVHSANLIRDVLERQVPKTPTSNDNGGFPEYFETWLECPVCGESIPEYTAENETECYCSGCGQKLLWGND